VGQFPHYEELQESNGSALVPPFFPQLLLMSEKRSWLRLVKKSVKNGKELIVDEIDRGNEYK
jgi:hypothetical protein